jgi:hypothetical protein
MGEEKLVSETMAPGFGSFREAARLLERLKAHGAEHPEQVDSCINLLKIVNEGAVADYEEHESCAGRFPIKTDLEGEEPY